MSKSIISGLLGLVVFAATGHAAVYTYVGTTAGGNVNVSATLTANAGSLTLILTNNTTNIGGVGQAISDIFFNLGALNLTGSSLTSITGTQVIVASDGTTTAGSANPLLAWTLAYGEGGFPTSFHLNALGTGEPELTIIGPPTAGVYSSANSSIAGNGPHNPFFNTSATFTITNALITTQTALPTSVVFSFGTTAGDNHTGCLVGTNCTPSVPEPITSGLVGTGLIALFFVRRRMTR